MVDRSRQQKSLLYPYLSSEYLKVWTFSGKAKVLVEEYGAGVCFEPEYESDFLEKVILLKDNELLYRKIQEGCARLALDYARKILARRMLSVLLEVAEV